MAKMTFSFHDACVSLVEVDADHLVRTCRLPHERAEFIVGSSIAQTIEATASLGYAPSQPNGLIFSNRNQCHGGPSPRNDDAASIQGSIRELWLGAKWLGRDPQ
ncbi:hypothetical protein ANO11243_052120 [Dothideomycetidae sp. 11243]|nr:hypothetical protein ANO11243_052120 [fungal sp. No.11243]